jgi:4,5-dihydroxyphthalate decarboxylase
MAPVIMTFGCYDYDRTLPIMDGRVPVEGCEIAPIRLKSEALFPRALQRAEFDIAELSVSSYLMETSKGTSEYIAVPAFVSRGFRHSAIYINKNSGIENPKDLEGKLVGVPEYQVTISLWVRGILQDEYGVDFHKMKYRNGGMNVAGRKERLPINVPDTVDVEPIPQDKCLSDMLAAGELDAVISPEKLTCYLEKDPNVSLLFKDPVPEEKKYFKKTGMYPIFHFIVIRKAIVEENPWVPANVFKALVEAKKIAVQELDDIAEYSALKLTLPWFVSDLDETRELMGDDYWPYGVEPNRKELETMCRYSHEQYLSERLLTVDELFAPDTLTMPGR